MSLAEVYKLIKHGNELLESGKLSSYAMLFEKGANPPQNNSQKGDTSSSGDTQNKQAQQRVPKLQEGNIVMINERYYQILAKVGNFATAISIPLTSDATVYDEKINPDNFHAHLKLHANVETPIGVAHVDSAYLENHFLGKKEHDSLISSDDVKKEARWRKKLAQYFIMTLEKPSEIWLNWRANEWRFSLIRMFRAVFKNEVVDLFIVAVVSAKSGNAVTYYGEKISPSKVHKYRRVYLLSPTKEKRGAIPLA